MSVKWWFNTLEPTHNPYASQILSKTYVINDVPLQVNAIELLFNTDQSLFPPVCPLLVVGHASSTVAQLPRRQGPRSPSRVFDRWLLLLPDFLHKRYLNPASRMPASVERYSRVVAPGHVRHTYKVWKLSDEFRIVPEFRWSHCQLPLKLAIKGAQISG